MVNPSILMFFNKCERFYQCKVSLLIDRDIIENIKLITEPLNFYWLSMISSKAIKWDESECDLNRKITKIWSQKTSNKNFKLLIHQKAVLFYEVVLI